MNSTLNFISMTKELVLQAISLLIVKYQDEIQPRGQHSCPLCKIFYRDNGDYLHESISECTICPNVAFAKRQYTRSCYERGDMFEKLSCHWYRDCDFDALVSYWKEIEILFTKTSEKDILNLSESLQASIRVIAEKYK